MTVEPSAGGNPRIETKEFNAMRKIVSAAAFACILTGAAVAQGTTSPGSTTSPSGGATKMSQADCSASWTRLDTAKSGKVSETQAKSTVSNFASADVDKDGNLTQSEFMDACQKGLVTASSGTGSRALSGSDSTAPKSDSTNPTSPGKGGTSK